MLVPGTTIASRVGSATTVLAAAPRALVGVGAMAGWPRATNRRHNKLCILPLTHNVCRYPFYKQKQKGLGRAGFWNACGLTNVLVAGNGGRPVVAPQQRLLARGIGVRHSTRCTVAVRGALAAEHTLGAVRDGRVQTGRQRHQQAAPRGATMQCACCVIAALGGKRESTLISGP